MPWAFCWRAQRRCDEQRSPHLRPLRAAKRTCASGGRGHPRNTAPGRWCSRLPAGSGSRGHRTPFGHGSHERYSGRKPPAKMTTPKPERSTDSGACESKAPGSSILQRDPEFCCAALDKAHQLEIALISPSEALAQVRSEPGHPVLRSQEVTGEGDSHRLKCAQVQISAAAVAGGQGVGGEARRRSRESLDRLIEEARFSQPPDNIATAEAARNPCRLAAGEDHLSARLPQFFTDLGSGLAAADDEYASSRQDALVPEGINVHSRQVGGQRVSARRSVSALISACGQNQDTAAQHRRTSCVR